VSECKRRGLWLGLPLLEDLGEHMPGSHWTHMEWMPSHFIDRDPSVLRRRTDLGSRSFHGEANREGLAGREEMSLLYDLSIGRVVE
jgi:hypothetical protein